MIQISIQMTTSDIVVGLKSIHLADDARNLDVMMVCGIVIVGSSCAGKSIVVDGIRKSKELAKLGVTVPKRYITRPKRLRDNVIENCHVTSDEFEEMVQTREIGLHWVRQMEGGREERYGFEDSDSGVLPIYSGNNAFYDYPESVHPVDACDKLLVVGVYAPDSVREERLVARSPDLLQHRPEEVRYRLGDSSDNILACVDVVIENHGEREDIAVVETIELIGRIARMSATAFV